MLPEIGKTTIERVSPCIDNPGVGQDKMDQAGVNPVVGQLVDKKWLIGFALNSGALDKLGAQIA